MGAPGSSLPTALGGGVPTCPPSLELVEWQARAGADVRRPQDKVQLLRLWYHESCRVFRDRLVNGEDRHWFDKLLESHMEPWEVAFNEVCPHQPILYGDFMSPGSDVKSYELITSEKKVRGLAGALPLLGPRLSARGPRPSVATAHRHGTVTAGQDAELEGYPRMGLQASTCLSKCVSSPVRREAAGPAWPPLSPSL